MQKEFRIKESCDGNEECLSLMVHIEGDRSVSIDTGNAYVMPQTCDPHQLSSSNMTFSFIHDTNHARMIPSRGDLLFVTDAIHVRPMVQEPANGAFAQRRDFEDARRHIKY